MKSRYTLLLAALLGSGTLSTAAQAQFTPEFKFSGFGTLAALKTNTDEAKLGRDRQITGADKQASLDVDSNLGLQVTGTATPWLSATVQVLAAKRDEDKIEPKVEWAFVNLKPFEGLTARVGRMAAPVFAVSDSRNIGYANTWVRAPNEVYGLNLFRNMEGADVTYRTTLGPVAVSATAIAGKTKFKVLFGADATGEDLQGLNVLLESDWVNLRLGQVKTKVAVPAFFVTNDPYTFTGIGATVDRNNVVVQAEFVTRRSATSPDLVNADSWYVMGGYRLGAWLPYAIVSHTKPQTPTSPILLSAQQKTTAIGFRWDAFSSAAIKFQIDRIDTNRTQGVSFSGPVTSPVTAATASVDFIF